MSYPACCRASAVALPMPRLEPVTNATRLDIVLLLWGFVDNNSIIWLIAICATSSARWKKKGELQRISVEVDPVLEITEFADRAVKQGGPALLFEKPKGYTIPVLINSFASDAQDADRARGGFGR